MLSSNNILINNNPDNLESEPPNFQFLYQIWNRLRKNTNNASKYYTGESSIRIRSSSSMQNTLEVKNCVAKMNNTVTSVKFLR